MIKNKKLSKSIADASWSEFVRQLEYKSNWYNSILIKIDQFYPSSKTCSTCLSVNKELKLSHRIWTCKACATTHDRDINAAVNIEQEGKRKLKELISKGLINKDLLPLLSEIFSDNKNKNNTNSINNKLSSKEELPWGAREVKQVDNDKLLYN